MLLTSKSSTAPSSDASSAARARASRYARRRVKSTRSSKSTFMRPGLGGTPPGGVVRLIDDISCSLSQLIAHPVRHRRAVLVSDVVADVIPIGIHQERGVRRL